MKRREHASILIELSLSALNTRESPRLIPIIRNEDWASIADMAFRHGLTPLMIAGIRNRNARIPSALFNDLQRRSRVSLLRNVHAIKQAEFLVESFNSAGITPVILKGLFFAARIYPSPSLRPFADIDILIRPEELPLAADAALDLGYVIPKDERGHDVEWWLSKHNHIAFVPQSGHCVELHWNLMPPNSPVQFDLDGFRARCSDISLGNARALAFAPEDQILYLAVHASKHQFRVPLRSFLDLAAIVRASNCVNWSLVLELAEEIGAVDDLAAFLGVSDQLGVFALPHAMRNLSASNTKLDHRALADYVIEWPYFDMPESVLNAISNKSARELRSSVRAALHPLRAASKAREALLHGANVRTAAEVKRLFGNREAP